MPFQSIPNCKNLLYPKFFLSTGDEQNDFFTDLNANKTLYLNIMVLSVTWFTFGYNYYGAMNSWRIISPFQKMFEHNILASVLALVSKILCLLLCCAVHQKCLPLMILQIFTSICYFLLSSVKFCEFELGKTFVVHMTTFLITASFGIVWVITPETFPKKYR